MGEKVDELIEIALAESESDLKEKTKSFFKLRREAGSEEVEKEKDGRKLALLKMLTASPVLRERARWS